MTRSLPHGWYSLIVVVLSASGWFASLWQGDGCNYAIVSGPIVDQLEASPENPYNSKRYITTLELGFDSYRELPNKMSIDVEPEAPMDGSGDGGADGDEIDNDGSDFVPSLSTTISATVVTNATTDHLLQKHKASCMAYPEEVSNGIVDSSWTTSRSFAFFGLVMGGAGTTFLACSLCFVFSRVTWRWTGYGLLLASLCQALSLVSWFGTQMCSWNDCGWSLGSISDAYAVAIWALTGGMVMLHYPPVTLAATIPGPIKTTPESDDIEKDLGGSGTPTTLHSYDEDEESDQLRYPHAQIA